MKHILLAICWLFLVGCVTVPTNNFEKKALMMLKDEPFAVAMLQAKSGSRAEGKAWFVKNDEGLQIVALVNRLTPGLHGIHIHEKGDCSDAEAASAGPHYNPTAHMHGSPDPEHFHAGDLGNIEVQEDGTGLLNLLIKTPVNEGITGWSHIVGKSLIVHQMPDDLISQPSGNSGDRIACGVIVSH